MDQRSRTPSDSDLAKSPGITKADLPERFKLDLASLQCQDDYLSSVFELLKETSLLAVLLVHGIPVTPFSRNEAIRRGLLKRLTLLGKSLLCDISQNSAYQQEQLSRQIVETAANYFYLSADEGSGERYDSYVLNSLAEEKASLAIIASQIKKRGGDPEPIEKRMRRSIERMAIAAGVDFDAVPGKSKSGWPSAMERLEALSPVAYMPYRTGSNALHSGWSVLLLRDIEPVEGGFSLENTTHPAVQPMSAACLMIAEAAVHYLQHDGNEIEQDFFLDRLEEVGIEISALDQAHEAYMQTFETPNGTAAG